MSKKLNKEEEHKELMKKIKGVFKQGLLYYFLGLITVVTLIILHSPPIYYSGTTLSAITYFYNDERYDQLVILFFLILTWAVVMIPLFLLFKGKWFGKIALALFSFFVGVEKYVFYIQGENAPWNSAFNRDTLETYLSEATIGGIKDVYTTYGHDFHFFLYLLIFPIAIFIFISVLLKFTKPVKQWVSAVSLLVFIFLLSTFTSELNAPYMYKVPLVLENYVVDYTMERVLNKKRHEVFFKDLDKTKETPQNIIFVMDESIRGDLISLNNQEEAVMKTTPFLYSMKDKLINFGDSYSMGNCSQISNMLFIAGFNGALDTKPMIFQYMQNAGYETYLIDSPHDRLLDGFYYYDKPYIDNYISVRYEDKMKRDLTGLKKVQDILKKPGKHFIYVLKQGAHFPFEENFKKEDAVLPIEGLSKEETDFNIYMNALKVAVDDYWKELIHVMGSTDSIVLWQGDHGVNIAPDKGDKAVKLTHCEIGLTYKEELYNVASAMYSPNKDYYKGYYNLENGYSTVHMLPTLLDFAGYKIEDIKKNYNTTYRNPDKNITLFTMTNWGSNPLIKENTIPLEIIEKEGVEKGVIDKKVIKSKFNKRRKLTNTP